MLPWASSQFTIFSTQTLKQLFLLYLLGIFPFYNLLKSTFETTNVFACYSSLAISSFYYLLTSPLREKKKDISTEHI